MHEEAMLRDVIRKAEEVAQREGGQRVTRVRLWLGARSHLTGQDFRDRWADAVGGTVLARAEVEVEVSRDPNDPRAERVMLQSLDVESGEEPS